MNNPYIDIIKSINDKTLISPSIQLGTMLNSNTLKVGELQLNKGDFYIADYLKKGYKRHLETEGVVRKYETKDEIKNGDTVAVMCTEDMQTYIVLAKVILS